MPLNTRLFIWFRLLFNSRFYYPVLAIFFVDLGISLDQYALLNVVWAATIVVCEIPMGALADRVGRRPLVVGAAAVMVLEMAVLAFVPAGDPGTLFWIFLVNRILSGIAEAAASGADEALAYDTLVCEGTESSWPQVLVKLQRRSAIAFVVAMVLGGFLYDSVRLSALLGVDLAATTTARFPMYATLCLAVGALIAALRMTEPDPAKLVEHKADSLRQTLGAGKWVFRNSFAASVILFAFLIDSPGRMVTTLISSIYRMMHVPEYLFGVLFALMGGVGFLAPAIAEWMRRRWTPWAIYVVIALSLNGALFGLSTGDIRIGIASIVVMGICFNLLSFFTSHYLNLLAPSETRATILSFRSLAGNLSYGFFGWLFAVFFRWGAGGIRPEPGSALESETLAMTLFWIPIVFLALIVPVLIRARGVTRMCECELKQS